MKILIIRTTATKVNLNTYNLQEIGLAKALVRRGHECDVMYHTDQKKDYVQEIIFDENLKVNILWLHGYGAFYEGIYPSLKRYINNYDIIQVSVYIGLTPCWIENFFGGKTIHYQGGYFYAENKGDILKAKIWDKVLLPFSNKKNMIVVTKSTLATEYMKSKGINNITTVGVGLDTEKLLNSPLDIYEHEFIKKINSEKEDYKYILYIGVIEERRNILFMLDTFNKVLQEQPNTKLIIIGKGKNEYVDKCKQKIKNLELDNQIYWCDRIEQQYLKAVYEVSDVFLLPTRYEIFGMVLLEAMYFGLPTFTTYNGGSSTIINDGENGFIINKLDVDKWNNDIVKVLKSKELYNKISQNAEKTIKEEYTWDALAEKFEKVYRGDL